MKHKSLEMKYLVSCAALNLLFLANFVSSQIADTTVYEYNITDTSSGQRVQFFNIRSPLHLSCNVTDEKARIEWRKDGKPISEISGLKSRSSFSPRGKLTVKEAVADDAGNYSCVIVDGDTTKESISITVSAKPAVKIPDNINIVEGEKLVVPCKVLGNPMPIVYWRNDNGPLNSSDERIKYSIDPETNINNTILIIEDVVLADRENYTCTARSPFSDNVYAEDSCNVRVKDKLAALWPFIGICIEVFVLCGIILVYEKKRNKAELEESDTDQSPDQKNTPDHGKDSDVRHRK